MANAQFDSVLAKKLTTFIRLSADELKCLASMQTNPIRIKRGKQLTQEGESGQVVEHLVSIGRRSAIERTAHFFMELATD